jgi:vancomycin resistance protein YoaR
MIEHDAPLAPPPHEVDDLDDAETLRGGRRPHLRRAPVRALAVVLGLCAIVVLLGVGVRLARPGVLPGTILDGQDLSRLDGPALRSAISAIAADRMEEPVRPVVRTPDGGPSATGDPSPARELGYTLDVEATTSRVLARGRQGNPLEALADQVRAFGEPIDVRPVEQVDPSPLAAWAERESEELRVAPVEGDARFDGLQVRTTLPSPGLDVDADALAEAGRRAALAPGPADADVTGATVVPTTSAAEVEAAAEVARQAIAAPIVLRRGDASIQLAPEQLAAALRVDVQASGPSLEVDPAGLAPALGDLQRFTVAPVDATFALEGGVPRVVPGTDGFSVTPEAVADQVMEALTTAGPREVELQGEVVPPSRTTAEAEGLGITTQVSTFTTNHACCQNRVENIHRIADLVRGAVIAPGETFSVNDYVGERTREKGFLADGAIQNGEFVEEVGGGVSQFATTMYNAAFFGGYEIVEHKAHSQYISRYPEGREATLNFPNVDLKIKNDSPFGIYVDTSYSDTSITVTFYGTPWVAVSTEKGPRRSPRGPETIVRRVSDLPSGAERVVQTGSGEGFDVTVTRTLTFPDGRVETEEIFTSYVARPRIVERGR